MRKSTLLTAAALGMLGLSFSPAGAALTDYDPFDYTGTTLNGQNGGVGWNGGWFATEANLSQNLSNDSTSLSYPATFESPLATPPSSGARISTGGLAATASSSRLLSNTYDLSVDGTVMYASALIRKNAANGGGVNNDNILLEFVDSFGNRRFGLGIAGNGDFPWLNANGSGTAATAVVAGDTYLIVAKIVSSAAGSDQAFLKVFGSGYASEVPAAEPTTWDRTLTETTGAVLDRIRVRIDVGNTGDAAGEVDDIRIGTDWQSVVSAVPEPASAGAIGLAALGLLAGRRRRH